jgi:hypothetical protein
MKGLKIFLFSLMMLELASCNSNEITNQITVKGAVLDNQTGKPIANARVTLLVWRKVRYDEDTYDKVDTVANDKGIFQVEFTEGYKVDIGSIASNYYPIAKEVKDLKQASNIELRLNKNAADGVSEDLGQLASFVRDYNTTPRLESEYYGINILNGTNTKSLDSMDIGVEQSAEINYPKVLVTSERGGIVPIFKNTKNEINKAPKEGYVRRYQLKGNEQGFFIRCRDGKTYSRLMIYSLEYDRSTPYKNGHFKDYGIMFNVLLQNVGNEFNIPDTIRLDYYILETI